MIKSSNYSSFNFLNLNNLNSFFFFRKEHILFLPIDFYVVLGLGIRIILILRRN